MIKRIAVYLAKSVYQVAESVRGGQVSQRKRLSRAAFWHYIGTGESCSGVRPITKMIFVID
jgi:hypothetical protein